MIYSLSLSLFPLSGLGISLPLVLYVKLGSFHLQLFALLLLRLTPEKERKKTLRK